MQNCRKHIIIDPINVLILKCDNNEQWLKSKVQNKNTRQKQSKLGSLKKPEVGSGAMCI